jgi:hypothetical protein
MAYSINKTDGTILATVPDGQIDQLSSDITFIGKNYSGFGESLNENFVKLLENFANSSRPTRPVRGQIWFDTTESKLKVYTGIAFVPVSSATISRSQPLTLGVGDLWFNDVDKQLYFFDGVAPILLAPAFSQSQGKSGLEVQTVLDSNNISRVITILYNGGTLLGIFSKDQFIPKLSITGYSNIGEEKIIFPGFNAGILPNLKFNVTASNADRLDNTLAANFARKDQANIFNFQTIVRTDDGIAFGSASQGLLDTESGNVRISNTFSNRNLEINVRRGTEQEKAINIFSSLREVRIYEGQPTSITKVGGNLVVTGNLTVSGSTTTINTEVITLEDKNIELAKIPEPSDTFASGGGIIIKGNSDHRLIWIDLEGTNAEPGQAPGAWNTEESINIGAGKAYKIGTVDILTEDACNVPSFPNVNQLGTQLIVRVGSDNLDNTIAITKLIIQNTRISTLNVDAEDLDLELAPAGNIQIIGDRKIQGITTTDELFPSQTQQRTEALGPLSALSDSELSEAVSKKYTLNFVRRRSIVLSLDITDAPSNAAIALLLAQVAPPNEFETGTIARILCSSTSNSPVTLNINPALNKINDVEYNTPSGTNFPIQEFSVGPIVVPSQAVSVFRVVKTYQLSAGSWVFIS